MTGSMPIAANPPDGGRKLQAVGPSAGPRIRILNDDGSAVNSPQGEAEICVHGACVTKGYEYRPYMKADPNVAAFHVETDLKGGKGALWLRTGDKGFFDADGYLQLSGRFKEIINRGGEKIGPIEVEHVLRGHPALDDMVCFAVPHAVLGEVVGVAIVLKKPHAPPPSLADLRTFGAKQGLADKWLPELVHVLKEVPKGTTGNPTRIGLAVKLANSEISGNAPTGGGGAAPKFDSMALKAGSSGETGGGGAAAKNLQHFSGLSAWLTLWVVLSHYMPQEEGVNTPFTTLIPHAPWAMHYFSMLSGFSVHLSHGDDKPIGCSLPAWLRFWSSRLDRILLTVWFSYALIYIAQAANAVFVIDANKFLCPLTANLNAVAEDNVLGRLQIVSNEAFDSTQFIQPACDNVPVWFVAAMIPSWLAYPLLAYLLRRVGGFGATGYFVLAALAALVGGVLLLFISFHPTPQDIVQVGANAPGVTFPREFKVSPLTFLHFFMPFLMGCATAGLVRLHAADVVQPAGNTEATPLLPGRARKPGRSTGGLASCARMAFSAPQLARHYLTQRAVLRGIAADVAMILFACMMLQSGASLPLDGKADVQVFARVLALPLFMIFIYGSAAAGSHPHHLLSSLQL